MTGAWMIRLCAVALALVAPAGASWAQTYYHYECADGAQFQLAFFPETKAAFLQVDGKSIMLPKRFSLVSQRFSKGGISLSLKRDGFATIKHSGRTSQCKVR